MKTDRKTKKKQKDTTPKPRGWFWDSLLNNRVSAFLYDKKEALGEWMCKFVYPLVSSKKKQYVFSLICAIILSIVCYFKENRAFSHSDNSFLFYVLEMPIRQWTQKSDLNVHFINVSQDRQLVYLDPYDSTMGNTDITDRHKLLQFLQKLDTGNVHYSGILMDLRFDKAHVTEWDTLLFNQIMRMRNVVVANHKGDAWDSYDIASEELLSKSGISDYPQVAYMTSFSKYTFLHKKGPSLPLKLYDDIYNQGKTSMKQCLGLPMYVSGGHLCINSPMLPIIGDVYDIFSAPSEESDVDGSVQLYNFYENLGADWLAMEGRCWTADLDDSYIVIGDFENDVHATYVGSRPGAYITWLAYMYLYEGRHLISWLYIIVIFIFYALMIYWMFFLNNIARSPLYSHNEHAHFVLSQLRWLGTIGLLYLMTFVFYKIFSVRYVVGIPMMFIALVNIIIHKANKYEENFIASSHCADGD